MNLTLLKKLQSQVGQLPVGVGATRAVTELSNGQLKAVAGGPTIPTGGGSGTGGGSSKR